MSNPVVHFEVIGKDGEALKRFYGDLFDWEIQSVPEMGYHMVAAADGGIGGGIGQPPPGRDSSWVTFYVQVDDINATLEQAKAAGGSVVMERTEMPMVTLALFTDPEGHTVGLVEAGGGQAA